MVCLLAARFGGTPQDWMGLDAIWLHTMTEIANQQDAARRAHRG